MDDCRKKSILVVDDVPANIKLVACFLKDDYDVLFATSGKEALELVTTSEVDLVLLDVVMPDMDGYDVCARLKSHPLYSEVPIIFVSGMDHKMNESQWKVLGAVDSISKPINQLELKKCIAYHLDVKQNLSEK